MKPVGKITEDIGVKVYKLIEDEVFVEITAFATTDTKIVKRRFEMVKRKLFCKRWLILRDWLVWTC